MAGPWEAFATSEPDVGVTADGRPSITVRPQSAMDQRARDLAIRTIYGEASAEPDEGKAAVAAVIRNRVDSGRFGKDVPSVVLAPNQFEPWMRQDARSRMMSIKPGTPDYDNIGGIVDRVFSGEMPDPTNGATHFYAPQAQAALGRQPPRWAANQEPLNIGRHSFYAPEGRVAQAAAQPQPQQQPSGPWTAFQSQPEAPPQQPFIPQQPDSRPDVGRGTAALEGLRAGATFNFGDELAGVAGASNTPPELRSPLSGASNFIRGGLQLGYEALTGGGDAQKKYATARDAVRNDQKAAEEQYPGTYLAGQVGGAIALPLGGALNAPTIAGRMGRGAALGAITGGASGAGEGVTGEDRASRAAVGSVAGGVIGAVAPPLIEGGAKLIGAAVSKPINMLRAGINPKGAAERAIGRAYREANAGDPNAVNRLNPSELTPGGPATVVDTLGQPGRNLIRSATNNSGEAADVINQPLQKRYTEQYGRLSQWFHDRFNYPDAHAQQQAIDKVEKTVNSKAYAQAMRDGRAGIWDQELADIAQAPAMQDAVKAAIRQAQNRSAPDVSQGAAISQRWVSQDGKPTLELWDLIKKQLDQEINVASRAGRKADVSELTAIKSKVVEKLDAAVPSYQTARSGAAAFFGEENALKAGQKFVKDDFGIPETRAVLAKMSPEERQLFQDGFVSRYLEIMAQRPDRSDLVRTIYNSPTAKQKIEIALGAKNATELEAALRVEGIMQQTLNAVRGGSNTTAQIIAGGLASGGAGGFLGFDPSTSGIVGALGVAGKKGIDARVARQIADMLMSSDPAVLNRAIKMLASNQRLMGALRSIDAASVRVGGSQGSAPAMSALQAPAIGRAENDQPVIPRPPGQ